MIQPLNPEITLTVAGCPPAKSEAKSIFSQGHPHHSRAIDLLREMKRALADNPRWNRVETRPVGLELAIVETRERACQSDATNFLGGAADTLQANRYKGGDVQGNRILSILEYLSQLNIAKIDNLLGNSEFIG